VPRRFPAAPAAAAIALSSLLLVTGALADPPVPAALDTNPPVRADRTRPVDLVICLDTSGSMDDLLDSTRARLWDIVNELGRMKPTPELRVGLVTYGSPDVASEAEGYVRVRTDLTSDLDALYAQLASLRSFGSDEYVGWALQAAVEAMSWSRDPDGLRLVFLAGNESADQAVERVDFRAVAAEARRMDIVINALYAGPRDEAVTANWPEVARAGGGNFSAFDAHAGLEQVTTPHDQELLALNARLNATYLPYGPNGQAGLLNQQAQDNNASRLGVQSCSSRIVAKGSALYDNASWDLVDAVLDESFQWSAIADADLPEALRGLSPADRAAHVARLRTAREEIQKRIQELSDEREAFLRQQRRAAEGADGLDAALREALLGEARAKGFDTDGC